MQKWRGPQVRERFCNLIGNSETVKNMSVRVSLIALVWLAVVPCSFAGNQSLELTSQLWYCPTPMGAYLLVQSHSDNKSIVQLGYRGATEKNFRWRKIVGQAKAADSIYEDIYVAFADGLIFRFGRTDIQLPRLSGDEIPNYLVVDKNSQTLFALTKVESKPIATTAPDGKNKRSPWRIYEYADGRWSRVADLPKELTDEFYPKMVIVNGKLEIYTIVSPGIVASWQLVKNKWIKGADYSVSKTIERIYPLFSAGKRILVAIDSSGTIRKVYIYQLKDTGSVKMFGPLKTDKGSFNVPVDLTVSAEADRIVIGYVDSQAKQIKLTRWSLSGKYLAKDETINPMAYSIPKQEPSMLFTVLMIAVVMLAIFTRGTPSSALPELPSNVDFASYWRRAVAFVIDFFPISFIASLFWYDHFKAMQISGDFLESLDIMQSDPQMYYMTMIVTAIYIGYCTAMEGRFGWTVGKYILRMQVRQLNKPAETPTWIQSLIRNIIKIIELSFIPLLFVMILTRTRQRVGDLIAGTIVVQLNSERTNFDIRDEGRSDNDG